ncbi:unnamed protein product [Rhizoctonia solani]|uniref:Uncharacterized protein n=1 Tax=Rhizoctonia solani TaxID=456999 RepID=A0A8H3DD26_9AGAM|nr:unnamed protein product [Rhizoctonia solani]
MIVGMNALIRRSCIYSVRSFSNAAKPGGSGNNNKKYQNGGRKWGQHKSGHKAKPAPEPKPKPKPAPKAALVPKTRPRPTLKPTPKPTPEPVAVSLSESSNPQEQSHIPLPSPNPPLSAYSLSPSKLRALIDLYHSSTSYITPETLSNTIDETFAPRRIAYNTNMRYESYLDLVAQRDELDAEPDRMVPTANELGGRGYGTPDGFAGALSAGTWSTSKAERARMVKAALWGVDPMAKIGLETLMEAKVELDAQEKEQEKK